MNINVNMLGIYNYFRENFNDITYKLALICIGLIVIFLIVLIKSKTSANIDSSLIIFTYTIFIMLFELSRLVGAMFYKRSFSNIIRYSNQNNGYEPNVSFIIPCKNEEKTIAKTVRKCFEAYYPKNKIEVIVINDGSTDDTIDVLNKLKSKYDKLKIVDWKINRGKRYAMAEGFRMAKGEIVIQLDSDSYIVPETFRNLIKLFRNNKVGAVSVHTDPENADENILTRMQAAYYFFSFRILKAAESTFLNVFCCSGCASAYRKKVIIPILDKWLSEKFLGLPVTWGDDRALTNWVLRKNYITIYTDQTKAYTLVPNKLRHFLKQQVRWKKGWFVNSLFVSKFIYKKEPFVSTTYLFPLMLVTLITPFVASRALIYNPIFKGIIPTFYILGVLLMATIFIIYYRYIARENKYWGYLFVWSAINLIFLSFILFYAILTIQNRKWGTR